MPSRAAPGILAIVLGACAAPPPVPVAAPAAARAPEPRAEARFAFASVERGRGILGVADAFTRAQGDFDRRARLRRASNVTEEELLRFAAEQVLPWKPAEQARWSAALDELSRALRGLGLPLPPEVLLVQTTGLEEFDAPYTRGPAIVIPARVVAGAHDPLGLLAHELFHVATRHRPAIRDATYALAGFRRVSPTTVSYPPELAATRVTNPDAPENAHAIAVTKGDRQLLVMPLVYAKVANPAELPNDLGSTIAVRLLEVDEGGRAAALHEIADTSYLARAAVNTGYAIHPEEVLADNFSLLVARRAGRRVEAAKPDVLDRLEATLRAVNGD